MAKRMFAARKQERIDDLEASVAYFAAGNKAESERGAVTDLLTNLGVPFLQSEITQVPPGQDPPDIRYRGAAFEIKEILDEGRRRHAEYKESLEIAERAKTTKDLYPLSGLSPRDISVTELLDEVAAVSNRLVGVKYPRETTSELDLVIYYNKLHVWGLVDSPFPTKAAEQLAGWRSVSVVMGHRTIVFLATWDAPVFLLNAVGVVSHRP